MCEHAGLCVHVVGYIPVYPDDRGRRGVSSTITLCCTPLRQDLSLNVEVGWQLTILLSPPSPVLSFQAHMAVPRSWHECRGFKLSASCVCGRHSHTPSDPLTSHLFWRHLCSTCAQCQTHPTPTHSASPRRFNNHCGFERRLWAGSQRSVF